jgi:hypothetical protein
MRRGGNTSRHRPDTNILMDQQTAGKVKVADDGRPQANENAGLGSVPRALPSPARSGWAAEGDQKPPQNRQLQALQRTDRKNPMSGPGPRICGRGTSTRRARSRAPSARLLWMDAAAKSGRTPIFRIFGPRSFAAHPARMGAKTMTEPSLSGRSSTSRWRSSEILRQARGTCCTGILGKSSDNVPGGCRSKAPDIA